MVLDVRIERNYAPEIHTLGDEQLDNYHAEILNYVTATFEGLNIYFCKSGHLIKKNYPVLSFLMFLQKHLNIILVSKRMR